jgi:hypothetical protein
LAILDVTLAFVLALLAILVSAMAQKGVDRQARHASERAGEVDRRACWGILLVAVAYSLLWQNRFWKRPLPG